MSIDSGRSPHRRTRWFEPFLAVVFVVVATVFCAVPIINHQRKVHRGEHGTKDYPMWYESGQLELHGQTPYYAGMNHEYPFMYPPGAAVILAVMSIGGRIPLMAMQVLINTAAWGVAIFAPVYLLTGRLRPGDDAGGPLRLMLWVPSLVCVIYIWDTYLEGQPAFLLSSLLLLMFVSLKQKKSWGAGLSLAVAAGLKGFPILALPYLLWRREWKAVAYTGGFLVLLVVILPMFFRGPAGAVADLRAWSVNMMAKQTPEVIGQRAARSYTWQNGSLTSVMHRWLRPVDADHDDRLPPIRINVANVKFETINTMVNLTAALFGLGYVLVMPWRDHQRTAFTNTTEAAMLLILVILFAPLSFTYNNSWLMCGIAVVIFFITRKAPTRTHAAVATAWLTIALVPLIFSINHPAFRVLRARGNTFFSDVMVLLELGWILWIEQRREARPTTQLETDPLPVDAKAVFAPAAGGVSDSV